LGKISRVLAIDTMIAVRFHSRWDQPVFVRETAVAKGTLASRSRWGAATLECLMTPLRPLISLISTLVLVASLYLLWTWYQGEVIQQPNNTFSVEREGWRLWVGGVLLAWSFLGRWLIMLLLARPDSDPMRRSSDGGEVIRGADGEELRIYVHGRTNAPVILMTHGWSLDHSVWQYAVRDLSKEFRVVTWDLPGLGRSSASKISLSNMAANLQIIINHRSLCCWSVTVSAG
jgi:hypothetical protein